MSLTVREDTGDDGWGARDAAATTDAGSGTTNADTDPAIAIIATIKAFMEKLIFLG